MSLKADAQRSAARSPFFGLVLKKGNSRRGGGNVEIAQRFPRAVGREGNLLSVFLPSHNPSFPRPSWFSSCAALLAANGQQLSLGSLHFHRRLSVGFRRRQFRQLIHRQI